MNICLNIGEQASEDDDDLESICQECGAVCCGLGGVVATQREVDAIRARGYPNYFVEIAAGIYGTEWGEKGECAYLKENQCTIHAVRPLGCRMFPVVQTRSEDIILIECPRASYLTEEQLESRKRMLMQRPRRIITKSDQHRDDHLDDLVMRASQFKHRKL